MNKTVFFLLRIAPLFLLTAGEAFARAGGVSGSRGGMSSLKVKLALGVVGVVYAIIHATVIMGKQRRSDALWEKSRLAILHGAALR